MSNGCRRSAIKIGSSVSIILKKDQKSQKTTNGIVQDILTNSTNHPHGIKVRLTNGGVGRITTIINRSMSTIPSCITSEEEEDNMVAVPSFISLGHYFPEQALRKEALESAKEEVVQEDMWSCGGCTFLNHPSLHHCEMCNSKKEI